MNQNGLIQKHSTQHHIKIDVYSDKTKEIDTNVIRRIVASDLTKDNINVTDIDIKTHHLLKTIDISETKKDKRKHAEKASAKTFFSGCRAAHPYLALATSPYYTEPRKTS
ncbi:hypothetical protein [Acetobacter senegalensis]|uniref:hypothetical protein n=1 Tax=Acetobacter senegalensis TaxID=446692 RepID=UPI00264B773A|nr:hypothetical protein [Acetobacter senegalensis]MDN7350425.1 hypothetical protein [Acetobacter senegalensis]